METIERLDRQRARLSPTMKQKWNPRMFPLFWLLSRSLRPAFVCSYAPLQGFTLDLFSAFLVYLGYCRCWVVSSHSTLVFSLLQRKLALTLAYETSAPDGIKRSAPPLERRRRGIHRDADIKSRRPQSLFHPLSALPINWVG